MTNITINTNGDISINGNATGWKVFQQEGGTAVFRVRKSPAPVLRYTENGWIKAEGFSDKFVRVLMPSRRYALSCNAPASGRPGRADFEKDLLSAMALYKENQWQNKDGAALGLVMREER